MSEFAHVESFGHDYQFNPYIPNVLTRVCTNINHCVCCYDMIAKTCLQPYTKLTL